MMSQEILFRYSLAGLLVHCGKSHSRPASIGFKLKNINVYVRVCVHVCISARIGVNRKRDLFLFLKDLFESTFVLAAAGCNTQNTTRHKHVTGKVKLTSEVTNNSEIYFKHKTLV